MATKAVLLSVIVFLVGVIAATGQVHQSEGDRPYTPTRREWIALELNANWREDLTKNDFSMQFAAPRYQEDTILIFVNYLPSVNRQIMNGAIEAAKQAIAIEAKGHGWSWLKVKEQVQMNDLK
jgi:hypothetical protein